MAQPLRLVRNRRRAGEGKHESRTGSKNRVGAGRIALFGISVSPGDVYATRSCDVHDVQPLRHAWGFLASGNPQPIGESQPDRLHRMVQLRSRRDHGHSGIAQHDCTWRTDRRGCSRGYRRSLDRAGTSEAACGQPCVVVINHDDRSSPYRRRDHLLEELKAGPFSVCLDRRIDFECKRQGSAPIFT